MVPYFSFILTFILPPLQVWGQTVQDDWTAPAAPDGSTPLQSGTKFTLLWKFGLQNNFKTYCPSCDTQKLDLWITNFNGTKYTSKIGREYSLAVCPYAPKIDFARRGHRCYHDHFLRLERERSF
jgi:hypothetical protein